MNRPSNKNQFQGFSGTKRKWQKEKKAKDGTIRHANGFTGSG
jgi:hypothetical protein